jgi:hypothetical protein
MGIEELIIHTNELLSEVWERARDSIELVANAEGLPEIRLIEGSVTEKPKTALTIDQFVTAYVRLYDEAIEAFGLSRDKSKAEANVLPTLTRLIKANPSVQKRLDKLLLVTEWYLELNCTDSRKQPYVRESHYFLSKGGIGGVPTIYPILDAEKEYDASNGDEPANFRVGRTL